MRISFGICRRLCEKVSDLLYKLYEMTTHSSCANDLHSVGMQVLEIGAGWSQGRSCPHRTVGL